MAWRAVASSIPEVRCLDKTSLLNRRPSSVSYPAHLHHATLGPTGIVAMEHGLDSDLESRVLKKSALDPV